MGHTYAVKRWPPATTAARVLDVHRVLLGGRQNGCRFLPAYQPGGDGETVIRDRTGIWEVAEWMPGEPLNAQASATEIEAGASAIAYFQRSVLSFGAKLQPPPAVLARLQRVAELKPKMAAICDFPDFHGWGLGPTESGKMTAESVRLAEAVRAARSLMAEHWSLVAERIRVDLSRYRQRSLATQFVLRDIHRDHLLFRDGKVTGMIDFDALRVDTPTTDLSRWVMGFLAPEPSPAPEPSLAPEPRGDFPGHARLSEPRPQRLTDTDTSRFDRRRHEVWAAALAGFRQVSPFSNEEARLARSLLFSSVWISLANWLGWLVLEQRVFKADPGVVANRIGDLTRVARSLGSRNHPDGDLA